MLIPSVAATVLYHLTVAVVSREMMLQVSSKGDAPHFRKICQLLCAHVLLCLVQPFVKAFSKR